MSELLEKFEYYELRKQWCCEKYWPTGQAADNWRAKLTGLIAAQGFSYSEERQKEIERIGKMLDGSFDIDKDMPKPVEITPEQLSKIIK